MMQELIQDSNMHVVNSSATKGVWTRENRQKTDEKSIIDYLIITKENMDKIHEMEIDEEGSLRIKGKQKSDHNTITATLKLQHTKKKEKISIPKTANTEGWKKVNEQIRNTEFPEEESYEEKIGKIKNIMKTELGVYHITTPGRRKEPDEIKKLRETMKEN